MRIIFVLACLILGTVLLAFLAPGKNRARAEYRQDIHKRRQQRNEQRVIHPQQRKADKQLEKRER